MKKLLLASLVAVLATTTAYADNNDTDDMDVTGKVIADLTVAKVKALIFPNLVLDPAKDTSVALDCTDNADAPKLVTYSGEGNPFVNGTAATTTVDSSSLNLAVATGTENTGQCGSLTVTGQAGYKYTATAADSSAADATTKVVFSDGSCSSATTLTLSGAGGTDTLYCGGKITAPFATPAVVGDIALTSTVTVIYD